MTGYLNIPDMPDLVERIADAIWAAAPVQPGLAERTRAEHVLRLLRGLSVEPTGEAAIRADERQQLAARLYRAIDAIHGSPAHQLRMEPGTALDGIEWAADYLRNVGPVAAPVPVQEDRP